MPKTFSTFSILDHLGSPHLKIVKETPSEYHCICPVCGDDNLKIQKRGERAGRYACYSNGCAIQAIREEISPWLGNVGSVASDYRTIHRQTSSQKAAPPSLIPDGTIVLAKPPKPATDIPQKQLRQDPERGEVWVVQYPYLETQWVERTEWADPTKHKGCDKIIIPYHLSSQGNIVKGKGNAPWPVYREDEADKYGLRGCLESIEFNF